MENIFFAIYGSNNKGVLGYYGGNDVVSVLELEDNDARQAIREFDIGEATAHKISTQNLNCTKA